MNYISRYILVLVCMTLLFVINSHQRELGIGEDSNNEPFETSNAKWDAIFQDSKLDELSEETRNLNVLNTFGKETVEESSKHNSKLSEIEHLFEDEVFSHEHTGVNKNSDAKNNKNNFSDKQIKPEITLDLILTERKEFPVKVQQVVSESPDAPMNVDNIKSEDQSDSILNLHNSVVETDEQPETLNLRSFIFNPNAKPQEKFQNCTTPKNESGTCRYLQHCLIPTIVSSLSQFMGYVCIIEEEFIGVCCPNFPVSVLTVKDVKEPTNLETNENKECGVGTDRRIVGGLNADPKAWPWMVALLSKFGKKLYCGGVLINDRYVLTAAHCTFGFLLNEIVARLGEYDFKNDGGAHIEYAVIEIKRHGHFNRRRLTNDIALLKLEKPVVFNELIGTICFPDEKETYVSELAILVGWGHIAGGGTTSNVLQQASLPVISNVACSKRHGLTIQPFLICTSSESGDKGACNGDSGGPLMLLDKNNRWKVIGLVSWGRRGCNPEFPTVYTRVSHYLEWIKEHST